MLSAQLRDFQDCITAFQHFFFHSKNAARCIESSACVLVVSVCADALSASKAIAKVENNLFIGHSGLIGQISYSILINEKASPFGIGLLFYNSI